MIVTFKPIIIPGGKRKDGTWPVKIRVTFKGASRRLPTTLVCTDADLTRSGKIKNATLLDRAGELITRMRATLDGVSPFTLEAWDVDAVVGHIRAAMAVQSFRLDFFTFADELIAGKITHTRAYYQTALNALEVYLGKRRLDINDITRRMLLDFAESIGEVKAARHLAKLAYIYNEARKRFNDEDAGAIVIPRMPFTGMPRIKPQGKGQRALAPEVVQLFMDSLWEPMEDYERAALAACLVSFGTMGANLADLYDAAPPVDGVLEYRRHKTGVPARVRIEPELAAVVSVLGGGSDLGVWLPGLRRWGTADTATHNVNKRLREWAERHGVQPFTFYAFRKAWGTQARRLGIEKATIDEALAHVGDFKMTDIYAERNWSLAWDANRRVLELFRWPAAHE